MSIVFLEDSWDTYGIDHFILTSLFPKGMHICHICSVLPWSQPVNHFEPLLFDIVVILLCAAVFRRNIKALVPPNHIHLSGIFHEINHPAIFSYHHDYGNIQASQGQRCVAARGPEHLGRRVFPWFLWENDLEMVGIGPAMGHPIWGTKNWMGKHGKHDWYPLK